MNVTFAQLRGWLATVVPLPTPIEPGPEVPSWIPSRMVILTPVSGPGLTTEDLFDVVGWQARCVGDQDNYDDAEALADTVDKTLLRQPWPSWTLRVIRFGSGPTPLVRDDAQRTHFVANYLFEVPSGLEVPA